MSMMVANAWIKNPTVGWEQVGVDTEKTYDNLSEVMESFTKEHGFKILRSWNRAQCGKMSIYRMVMRTEYQLEHPDANQAEWESEITVMEE